MAEQSSHNVVNEPQSSSAQLADAASSQTAANTATNGAQQTPSSSKSATENANDVSRSANELATSANASASSADPVAGKDAPEPSAGEAAHPPASDMRDASAQRGDVEPKTAEDGSQGDDRSAADVTSDTEKKGDANHLRSDSVKKPTTFSKVSVTKNFLNKAAPTTAAAPSKVGEKPSPASAATLTAKMGPRLVAKAGPSLGNLQKARPGPQSQGGPDASKVWNKNRPVPQAPPKQFTDEELKQQYGIHLATRLQSDEGGNESKWADIDDEDDWAPEAVEWMDGTKSTVAPQEAAPPEPQIMQRPAPQQQQQPPQPQSPAQRTVLHLAPRTQPTAQEPAPPASATEAPAATTQPEALTPAPPSNPVKPILAPKRSDSQSMKILKPGAAAIQAKLNGPSASGTEKPSLKAKNPAPPQTSPWKPVPKPDSVSAINPPTQTQHAPAQFAPLASQDARSYEQPQQIPARQIAADTFDRSWKEGEGGARELFNSANGRYEPAPEGRRSSVKHDGFRKPAVLQRQSHGQPSPEEPSAAFQSRTSAQMDGGWGNRRRGSSVSQSSNPAARRMSVQRSHDLPVAVSEGAPPSARNEPAKPTFSQQSAWDQQMPARPAGDAQPSPSHAEAVPAAEPAPSAEEVAKMQARVMKEKRELAQKRRKEEEEREAAAKAERLAAKLATLGGAGTSRKERDAEAAAAAAATKSVPKAAESAPAPVVQPNPAKPVETSKIVESLEAKALPLEPAHLDKQIPQAPSAKQQPPAGQSDRSELEHAQRQQPPRTGPFQQQANTAPYKASPSSYSSPGERPPQPFGRSPNNLSTGDSFTPWPTTAPNSNVWGTSGIGNGTFQGSGVFAPLPMNQQGSSLPLPPGMNRTPTSARISPQSFDAESRSPHMHQQQMGEQQRAYPPPGIEARSDAFGQPRRSGVPAHGLGNRQAHPPGPIGPPSRTQGQQHQQQTAATRAPPGTGGAWNAVSHQLSGESAQDRAAAAAAAAKRQEMVNRPSQPTENRFVETFKKTSSNQGALGAPRRYEKAEYTLHDPTGSHPLTSPLTEETPLAAAPFSAQTQPSAAFSGESASQDIRNHQAVENTVRIPNFSQNPAHGGQQPPIGRPQTHGQHKPAMARNANARNGNANVNANYRMTPLAPLIASKEQSPPPPESDGHPVNQGADSTHPHVKLPRPLAKVRLPPAEQQMQNGSVHMPQRPNSNWRTAPTGAARPIVQDEGWQARFNGLFGRASVQAETPPSPPKTPEKMSLAVASVSRASLDDHTAGATVSLPQAHKLPAAVTANLDRGAVTSKPAIDQMFYEELSFGSMPKVSVPRNTFYDNSAPPKNMKNMLKMGSNSKVHKPVESQTMHWSDHLLFPKSHSGYFAHVPLTKLNKMCHYIGGDRNGGGNKSHPGQGNQDRKPSGRQNKNTRGGRDNGEHGLKVAPVNLSGTRKPTGPRNSQPAAEGTNEGGSKRGAQKAARGGRNQGPATPAAAPVTAPAQSA